jgi:putative GTP pyrophosphokinase
MATADTPTDDASGEVSDFTAYGQEAVEAYREVRDRFEECAQAVRSVLRAVLDEERLKVQIVEARAKSVKSLREKAERPAKENAKKPKYPDPLSDITDLAGVRVVVYLLGDADQVGRLIYHEFEVLQKHSPIGRLGPGGYQSTHYLVRFKVPRSQLPEYERFHDLTVEIQVRTVLQHAWAEIEHGMVYKPEGPEDAAGADVGTRLLEVVGALRMADREFQRIDTESKDEPAEAPAKP